MGNAHNIEGPHTRSIIKITSVYKRATIKNLFVRVLWTKVWRIFFRFFLFNSLEVDFRLRLFDFILIITMDARNSF